MATYHVTVELRPGQIPGLDHPPLSPRDIVADSEEQAQRDAGGYLAEAIHRTWEYVLEKSGGNEALAAEQSNLDARWEIVARRVDRPAVDFKLLSTEVKTMRDGQWVGTRYNYAGPEGEQSCDILLDGVVSGRLVGRLNGPAPEQPEQLMRRWVLEAAEGALAPLVGRHWDAPVQSRIIDYPALEALADIRAALTSARRGRPGASGTTDKRRRPSRRPEAGNTPIA